jgi:hypothetical protein
VKKIFHVFQKKIFILFTTILNCSFLKQPTNKNSALVGTICVFDLFCKNTFKQTEKGKPVVRLGRKTTGPYICKDSGMAGREFICHTRPLLTFRRGFLLQEGQGLAPAGTTIT